MKIIWKLYENKENYMKMIWKWYENDMKMIWKWYLNNPFLSNRLIQMRFFNYLIRPKLE